MNRKAQTMVRSLMALLTLSVGIVLAQDYAVDWHTVDGGGEMWSTGGDYELGGTIGQADAGAMTGTTIPVDGGVLKGLL